jgi:hypothetical protein
MLPYDFANHMNSSNKEVACHAVFDEIHTKWTFEGRDALNEAQLTVLCVETFFGEVCNGGFEQYLFNEAGRNASLGPAALRRVGLPDYAELLEQVLARCVNKPEKNDFGISEDFFESPEFDEDKENEPLEDLEERFFEIYSANKAEFREKLFDYIVTNETAFV